MPGFSFPSVKIEEDILAGNGVRVETGSDTAQSVNTIIKRRDNIHLPICG